MPAGYCIFLCGILLICPANNRTDYEIQEGTNLDLLGRCSLCSFYITGVEFAVGCLLNLRLNMMVWDYSDRYLNVMGQICPEYWAYWYLLSIPAIMLSTIVLAVRKATGGEVNF